MADTDDYLSVYKKFFDDFAATVNPDDQLPVRVAGYFLREDEIVGEIVDWTLQYLNQRNCPAGLTAPITRQVLDEVKAACNKDAGACGYVNSKHAFDPLRLMQAVVSRVNEVCARYSDNGRAPALPPPPKNGLPISTCAIRNTRRLMEDRHVIIHDFHAVFGISDPSPASYYAVFDGHAGTDAAIYSVSHLHQFLAESPFYPKEPVRALKDAFHRTDQLFVEKSNIENLRSGTTVVCALFRPEDKKLYVAWLGDSQALLVRRDRMMLLVNPHKPDRPDERQRIENMGGCVMYYGTWRVNGQLAVSRAIGDSEYKPFVCADPDVTEVTLDGSEDFLVLACDGLWDYVSERQAAAAVYTHLLRHPDDVSGLSEQLVCLSKEQGSTDNISVIVALLRPARDMDMGGGALLHPPETLRGREQHRHEHERDHDQDDDLGPETSVDDGELQRQQLADLDPAAEPRQDAPTPPATALFPGQSEADNVADSGEDSEDEWNYFKGDPCGKAVDVQSFVQAKQSVCPEATQLDLKAQSDDSIDMESRLNPDAAEFVPSPTHSKPSFEDTIISQSPTGKIVPLDDVIVPSMAEFQQEISQRPGEICDDALSNSGIFSPLKKELHNGVNITDNDVANKKFDDLEVKLTEQNLAVFTSNNPFEVSEISSTKAEYGDESATSFAASDFLQKNLGSNTSNADSSVTETDFVLSETSTGKLSQDPFEFEAPGEFSDFRKDLENALPSSFSPLKDMGTIFFELQKEIAPTMEESPERVKLTDDLINPFSHEHPIAESPAEESEQLAGQEKVDELNESFEHSPNFTLDAIEVTSPLNPCAPSFDYQALDDTGNDKASELFNKSVPSAVDQTFTRTLDTVSGTKSSLAEDILAPTDPVQSADCVSPISAESVDSFQPTKISEGIEAKGNESLLQESSKSDLIDNRTTINLVEPTFEKSDFVELHEKNCDFEKQFEVDNFMSVSQSVVNKPDLIHEEERTLDAEFGKDFREMKQQVAEEYDEQELSREHGEIHGDSQKEEVKVNEECSTETNESTIQHKTDIIEALRDNSIDLIEEFSKFSQGSEIMQEPDLVETYSHNEKTDYPDKLNMLEVEQEMDIMQQMDLQNGLAEVENCFEEPLTTDKDNVIDELLKAPADGIEDFHKTSVGVFECPVKSEGSVIEKEDFNALLEKNIPENTSGQDVITGSGLQESNENAKSDYSETVPQFPDEKISLPATVSASESESDNWNVNGQISAVVTNVEEKDNISQVFSEKNEILDIPEKISAEFTETHQGGWPSELSDVPEQLRVCVFPLPVKQNETDVELISPSLMDSAEMEDSRKEVIEHSDYDTSLKVETLSGEQRDMMETLREKVNITSELREGELMANLTANEEKVFSEVKEEAEQITVELTEMKDKLNVEATLDKLSSINESSVDTVLKICEEASSEVKEVSKSIPREDAIPREDEPSKEIQETAMQDVGPPPPTQASQAELPIDSDSPELIAATGTLLPEPALAAVAAAGIAATAVAVSVKKEPSAKKLTAATTKDAKKTPTIKEPEKLKSTKMSAKPSPSSVKVTSKTSPTSPTKLSVAPTPRTSTPKKTTTPPVKTAPKVPVTTTKPSRPSSTTSKPSSVPALQKPQLSLAAKVSSATTVNKTNLKTASSVSAKPTTVRSVTASKPRVSGTTATSAAGVKTTLTNGDVKPTDAKKSSTATTKVAPRSHTAPPRTTAAKTGPGTTAGTVAKSTVQARTGVTSRTSITNGIASKPRVPTSTVPPRTAANLPTATDKQHKETANKHISARRVGTVPSKMAPAKVGVKKTPPTGKGAKAVPPANGGSPLISAGEGDKKKTDPLL